MEESWSDNRNVPSGRGPMTKECRPNYEKMIEALRLQSGVCTNLYNAVKEYLRHGSGLNRSRLMDMLGHLDVQADEYQARINELIKQQEAEGK